MAVINKNLKKCKIFKAIRIADTGKTEIMCYIRVLAHISFTQNQILKREMTTSTRYHII